MLALFGGVMSYGIRLPRTPRAVQTGIRYGNFVHCFGNDAFLELLLAFRAQ
jgi:hypothetical protein